METVSKAKSSRKRKGRSKPPTEAQIQAISGTFDKSLIKVKLDRQHLDRLLAQRGPTARPTQQMQQCKVPAFLAQMMGQVGSKPYRKPFRPFAAQQPRILSQMERVKSKL